MMNLFEFVDSSRCVYVFPKTAKQLHFGWGTNKMNPRVSTVGIPRAYVRKGYLYELRS